MVTEGKCLPPASDDCAKMEELWRYIYDREAEKLQLFTDCKKRLEMGKRPNKHLCIELKFGFKSKDRLSTKKAVLFATEFYSKHPQGSVPLSSNAHKTYRVIHRLLCKMQRFHPTKELSMAMSAADDILNLISYHGDPLLSQDEYRHDVTNAIARFVRYYNEYITDLDNYITTLSVESAGSHKDSPSDAAKIDEVDRKVAENGDKLDEIAEETKQTHADVKAIKKKINRKYGRQRFDDEKLDKFNHIWDRDQRTIKLKGTRCTYEASYNHSSREYRALGINSPNDVFIARKAALKRLARKLRKKAELIAAT